jgi:hypothetical protein
MEDRHYSDLLTLIGQRIPVLGGHRVTEILQVGTDLPENKNLFNRMVGNTDYPIPLYPVNLPLDYGQGETYHPTTWCRNKDISCLLVHITLVMGKDLKDTVDSLVLRINRVTQNFL